MRRPLRDDVLTTHTWLPRWSRGLFVFRPMRLLLCGIVLAGVLFKSVSARCGEEQTALLPVFPPVTTSSTGPTNFSELLRALLLESLKDEYVDDRQWRGTVERFDGFRIRGLRISKREREVPHGLWHRYRVRLIRPDQTFEVKFRQGDLTPEGKIPFSFLITLRARCEATFAWWTYGIKGINGTAVSHATLQLRLLLETSPTVAFSLDRPIPRLELRPVVTDVDLKLKDLDLRKLGVFKGDLVEILGKGSRKSVEELMQKQEGKIRISLQKSIDKAAE